MLPHYIGEDAPKNDVWGTVVKYLSEKERASFRLKFRDGKIYDASGKPFDTSGGSTVHSSGRAIFVMDAHGLFYASTQHEVGRFHHSSFLAGAPVAAAGEIEVRHGELKLISDKSGHYRPGRKFIEQALEQLKREKLKLRYVKRDLVGW